MRAMWLAGLALMMIAPAMAQTVAPLTGSTGTPAAAPPAVSRPSPPARAPRQGHRRTLQQRFDDANTSRDGHLTMAQAEAGMPSVARDFAAIDAGRKGYVTMDDIHAHNRAKRAARRAAR